MQSPEKQTRLGTISFVLAILVLLIWCLYFILFGAMTEGGFNFGMDDETAGYTLVFGGGAVMAILTILLASAGIVLGILSLRKKDPKRGLAIAGLALNFLCLAPYCLLSILALIGGISTADFVPPFAP
ncbi:MAG: hypothetical protein JETCAE01_24890 [Anaerolineaceae bacterium]|nr:MAG: hypothetical protein JETCAE01_24890 [Anaerolineaceae bacterium]